MITSTEYFLAMISSSALGATMSHFVFMLGLWKRAAIKNVKINSYNSEHALLANVIIGIIVGGVFGIYQFMDFGTAEQLMSIDKMILASFFLGYFSDKTIQRLVKTTQTM
jgi:hypothetical protein